MQPGPTNAEQQEKEVCPKCGAAISFKEKDGDVEFWDCPNCGKINLKKEQWKKLVLAPSKLPEVHVNCNFCKNKHSEKCPNSPNPDTCSMYEENKNVKHAEKIVTLIDAESPIFFKDQYGFYRIVINDLGILKHLKLDSPEFTDLCVDRFYRTFGKIPTKDTIRDAIKALGAFSRNSKTINVRNRVALTKGENGEWEIWIDLCDKYYRSIKITSKGYELIEQTPPLFRRFEHMETLCLPKKDGKDAKDDGVQEFCTPPMRIDSNIKYRGGGKNSYSISSLQSLPSFPYLFKIFNFLRVKEEEQILILSAIVSYFFVDYPFICVYILGKSGLGKSTGVKIIKRLLDPSKAVILAINRNIDQLLQDLDHHYFCAYDNVSHISQEYSDVFCRGSTGYGIAKRKHYTNDSDFLRIIKRPIWFNGISLAIIREDLLKRTILTEPLPILGKERTEEEIYAEFDKIKPYVLHDLFTLVSQVLAKLPTITPKKLFRMADYTKIGCAVAEVLGYSQDFFIEAYEKKQNDQIKEVIWNNTLGNVLYEFIENLPDWRGTPNTLYKLLRNQAQELGVSTRAKDYPKASNHMSREIKNLQEAFEKIGITIEFIKGTIREIQIINSNYKDAESQQIMLEKIEEIKSWILANKKDGKIVCTELNAKILEHGLDIPTINQKLLKEGFLFEVKEINALGVTK